MSLNATSGVGPLARRRRYRRLMYASIVLGSLGLIVASRFDHPVLGVGVYWAGVLGFLAIWRGSSVPVFDERDVALERQASLRTLQAVGAVGIVAIPAGVTLADLGYLTLPPAAYGAFYAYAALFVGFGVVYGWLRYGP